MNFQMFLSSVLLHQYLLSAILLHAKSVVSELVISPLQSRSGLSMDLILLPGPRPRPLCLPGGVAEGVAARANLALLVHSVCRDAGFTTFSDFSLVHVDSVRPRGDLEEVTSASEFSCHQTESYATVCNVSSSVEAECQHLVQLTCSSCHFHASLPPVNTSLAILSPLYPVLQPDYICEYDFFSDSPQDVSLHIEDINLPGHQYSQGHDSEYLWQRCCKV